MADFWEQNGTPQLVFVWVFHLGVKFSPLFLFMFLLALNLTCLTYALTILNFRRYSRRLSVVFAAHHSSFCTSCIVSAVFTTRTCTTYHLVTAFKQIFSNFCYYLLQLMNLSQKFPYSNFIQPLFLYWLILKC